MGELVERIPRSAPQLERWSLTTLFNIRGIVLHWHKGLSSLSRLIYIVVLNVLSRPDLDRPW